MAAQMGWLDRIVNVHWRTTPHGTFYIVYVKSQTFQLYRRNPPSADPPKGVFAGSFFAHFDTPTKSNPGNGALFTASTLASANSFVTAAQTFLTWTDAIGTILSSAFDGAPQPGNTAHIFYNVASQNSLSLPPYPGFPGFHYTVGAVFGIAGPFKSS